VIDDLPDENMKSQTPILILKETAMLSLLARASAAPTAAMSITTLSI
jgi:hypothetical protein